MAKAKKKIGPGRAAVREWKRYRRENLPKLNELVFNAFLRGVLCGQANPKTNLGLKPEPKFHPDGRAGI